MAEKKPRARKAPAGTKAAKPRVTARTRKVPVPTEADVAQHAYLLWESGADGDATAHWLRAERELAGAR